jgi:capsular polysaccharide export protein
MKSFRDHAPANALLVVKQHPLDNGSRRWRNVSARLACKAGLAERHVFLDVGSAEALLPVLAGIVTINSTVGLSSVLAGVPVKVLGQAIYDRAGLTDQRPLDLFWDGTMGPDPGIAATFRRDLRRFSHVPGTFDGPGALAGADNLARFLAGELT